MKRLIFSLLLVFVSFFGFAQDVSDQWIGHFSYLTIKDLVASDTSIYAASENAIFIFDIGTEATVAITTAHGLTGDFITALYYSDSFNKLIIGYENGVFQLYDAATKEFFTVTDIQRKVDLSEDQKTINHFLEHDGSLYLSTNFGISAYNLQRLEFGDSYFIGPNSSSINVAQAAIFENAIFAATKENGIYKSPDLGGNLIDASQWTIAASGRFKGIQAFGTNLVALTDKIDVPNTNINELLKYTGTIFSSFADYNNPARGIFSSKKFLTVTIGNRVYTYDTDFNLLSTIARTFSVTPSSFSRAISIGAYIYVGSEKNGFFKSEFNNSANLKLSGHEGLQSNKVRVVDASQKEVWVGYGQYNIFYAPISDNFGVSHFKDEIWESIPKPDLLGGAIFVDVAINPSNNEQVFFGSFTKGLLEIENGKAIQLWNSSNTEEGIESINTTSEDTRISSLNYDSKGDLWFSISLFEDTAVRKLSLKDRSFSKINLEPILPQSGSMRFGDLVFDQNDNLFLASYQDGVIATNNGVTLFKKLNSSLPSQDARALAIDQNDELWIGTRDGFRRYFNAPSIFSDMNPVAENIVVESEGIGQELLIGQFIWDIKVDGANKKWIATNDSGVFYLSEDGQETLAHFTKENSPLPSNLVQDIAIDDSTGKVYFATSQGLMEYNGFVTAGNQDLSKSRVFPNPVRPGFSGMVVVDGLRDESNVKITDLNGNLVFEQTSKGGSVGWDTYAFGRHKVATGVYLVLITAKDQAETNVTKLMIVR